MSALDHHFVTDMQDDSQPSSLRLVYHSPKNNFFRARAFFLFFVDLVLKYSIYLLYGIQQIFPERVYPRFLYPRYPIEDEIVSTSTRVFYTRSKHNKQPICLKLWRRSDEKVCNEKFVTRDVDDLLEGLEFNRRFAPDVYLGIAPINLSKDPKKILRGKLIVSPDKTKLKPGSDYALVMSWLESDKRLDYQLCQGILGTQRGLKFLAKEVARMHNRLKKSPVTMGKPDSIASKFVLNRELFVEALHALASERLNEDDCIKKYDCIIEVMGQACNTYTNYFEQRSQEGKIRRCHGDLKTSNLWVRPKRASGGYELIALDCIDFNPDFCHIDILSVVAMLAIDIEMHLSNWSDQCLNTYRGRKLAKYFLLNYLRAVQENSQATWPLLEYYMTEKAMVCAYVSILYDKQPSDGEKYLGVAFIHARRLEKMLKQYPKQTVSQILTLD
jgi:aminoglycoside phosphotransferase family enzyme